MWKNILSSLSLVILLTGISIVNAKKGFGPGSQEYGYVEVRKSAYMFYWLYYVNTLSENDAPEHPLVIWLQGGPGASGTGYGNFAEFGTLDMNLTERQSAWTKHVNVLYIDNPVGTGFSYVKNKKLYVKNNHEIAKDLVIFTKTFYKKFKKFSNTPMYIFCESYGGKMAIEFAYELYKEIKANNLKIKFEGVALGDSWISPIDSCLTWGQYLLNIGIIDTKGYLMIESFALDLKKSVTEGKWLDACSKWGQLENVVEQVTGGVSFYNILFGDRDNNYYNVYGFPRVSGKGRSEGLELKTIMNDQVKKALKSVIPKSVFWSDQSSDVFDNLKEDFMKPVIHYVEKVLNETKLQVVVYSGQLDLIVDTPGTLNWAEKLSWPGAKNWKDAEREILFINNKAEGYVKSYDKFSFYWINRAGHMVPADNPNASLEMLQKITHFKK